MMLLSLLTCVLLGALSAQAEVVQSFQNCKDFFYMGKEPTGMDENAQKICQKYGNHPNPFFATLYSEYHRIPLYSAYIFYGRTGSKQARSTRWFIEPQVRFMTFSQGLSGFNKKNMSLESEFSSSAIKVNQAINDDYKNTGYDRGHLNPASYQVDDGRMATFTLTNIAPEDPCFNRVHWKDWETKLQDIIKGKLLADNHQAKAYLVTGTIPSTSYRIPQTKVSQDDQRDLDRVTVPTHVWTALCYKHETDNHKSFSIAFIGQNQPESNITVMSVQRLNFELGNVSRQNQAVQIFFDDCFTNNKESKDVISSLEEKIQLPISKKLKIALDSCQTQPSVPMAENLCNSAKCKDDHPCDTHGHDSYWSEKASGSWDYCSLPLSENIEKYQINYACDKYCNNYYCYYALIIISIYFMYSICSCIRRSYTTGPLNA
uniref:Uncharacterized protein n=1 Tax=Paramormyrops kingsleyae TaxID=1676925 RepID=A0A3B3S1E5_9TELE